MRLNHFFSQFKNFLISSLDDSSVQRLSYLLGKLICLQRKLISLYSIYMGWIAPLPPTSLGKVEKNRGYDKWCEVRATQTSAIYNTMYQDKGPLFSILVPVYDPQFDWLQECIDSVKKQKYANWELILSNDGSRKKHIHLILKMASFSDSRIRFIESKTCNGISSATNKAANDSHGEYLVFLDHDDILDEYALTAFSKAIKENNKNEPIDILYADEDRFTHHRTRLFPSLKPQYSPDLLLATNYIHHPVAIRRDLFMHLKGLRKMYDGSQDHDLLLRAEEVCGQILHIPDVLYHMRVHPGSLSAGPQAKPEAHYRDRLLIAETMKRRGFDGKVVPAPEGYPGQNMIILRMPEKVSMSIIIIPDGNSDLNEINTYWDEVDCQIGQLGVPIAEQVNELAQKSTSDILIIASSEIRPVVGWKDALIPHSLRDDIGLVTGKISYHDNKLHSCGLVFGTNGATARWHHGWPSTDPGLGGWLAMNHEVSVVPWQFMGIRRKLFLKAGLFDTRFKFRGFELDLAFRLTKLLKLRHLAVPNAKASFVKGYPKNKFEKWDIDDLILLRNQWGEGLRQGDPYLNPNYTSTHDEIKLVDKPAIDIRIL